MLVDTQNQSIPKKKAQLIKSAQGLFWKYGVRRVTIEEICRQATVSKMTYYKYFANKWDIAKAVLDTLFAEGIKLFYEMLEEDIPFPQKVEMMLTLTTSRVHAVGSALLDDVMDPASPLHRYFIEKQKKTRELSVEFFKKAQRDGHISSDIEMPVLLFMLNRVSDFINDPDFIDIMPNIEDRASEIAALFFHGFSRARKIPK